MGRHHRRGGFLAWLNERHAPEGVRYRLPSEAEWEYAARAGTTTAYWVGDEISHQQANFDNGDSDFEGADRGQTLPIGSFQANPFGLHDVHGNVWEWVQDCWHDSYRNAPLDGSAWMNDNTGDCSLAVLRGGSW